MTSTKNSKIMTTGTGWCVEAIMLDDRPAFRVTQDGYLMGIGDGRFKVRGLAFSVAEVQSILGTEFPNLN